MFVKVSLAFFHIHSHSRFQSLNNNIMKIALINCNIMQPRSTVIQTNDVVTSVVLPIQDGALFFTIFLTVVCEGGSVDLALGWVHMAVFPY